MKKAEEENLAAGRNAGRGGVAVLGAKVFFVLTGLVQQILLPRVIGLAGYGALARVLALANIPNNVIVASGTQGVSRAVARAPGREHEALLATMRVHLPLAIVVSCAFAALAPSLASFEGAPHIAVPLAIVAIVSLLYGVYAPLIGFLNGRAQFTRQAALDVIFAILRTTGLLGVGFWFVHGGGSGVTGAVLGFVGAAACIVPIAARWASPWGAAGRATDRTGLPTPSTYLLELVPLAGAQFFTNAVMQVDITLLGRFLSRSASASGLSHDLATKSADEWVAVYRACQLFAFLPYQLLLSITQILFPMVARAKAEGDLVAVKTYVARGARLAAIACGMMVAVVAALPGTLLSFAYGADVGARGASTLRVLALGQGAYTMLAIATTVLASIGRERIAAAITFGALSAVSVACFGLVSGAAFGGAQLAATAIATSVALVLTLVVAGVTVERQTGSFVPLLTLVRVLFAVSLMVTAGLLLPRFGKLLTPVVSALVAVLYLAVLVVTGELTKADAKLVSSLRR